MLAFFRLVRAGNLLMIALSLSLFYYFILIPVHADKLRTTLVPFTHFEFVLLVLSVVFIAAAGYIINDYFDFEPDKEFKPERPVAQGDITLNTAMYLHIAFVIAGIALGYYLGSVVGHFKIGYIYIICALLLYLYSYSLKKVPLVGNVVISALAGFVFVLLLLFEADFLRMINFEGSSYAFAILVWQVKFYGGFAFLISMAREVVKTIEDKEGDAAFRINTVAVQFGEPVAKTIAIALLILLIAGLGYFMNSFLEAKAIKEFSYFLFAVVIPVVVAIVLLILAKDRKMYHTISLLLKMIMLLGILSIPVFYWLNHRA